MKAQSSSGVYQRGSAWWVDFVASDGRRIRKRVQTTTKAEAIRLRSVLMADAERGELRLPTHKKAVLFHSLVEQYIAHQKLHLKPNSLSGLPSQLNRARDFFGNVPVDQITPAQCSAYWDSVVEHFQKRAWADAAAGKLVRSETPQLKARTVNAYLLTLKALFRWAEDEVGIIAKNPTKSLKRRKGKSQAAHLKPVFILALHTGARRSEITRLNWSQVDLESERIVVNETKNHRLCPTPMTGTVKAILTELRERTGGCEYVFDDGTGKPSSLERAWVTARKRAGVLKDLCVHSLCHTATSRLVMAGVDLPTVGELLGNASQLKRYTHLTDAHKRSAIRALDTVPVCHTNDTSKQIIAVDNARSY